MAMAEHMLNPKRGGEGVLAARCEVGSYTATVHRYTLPTLLTYLGTLQGLIGVITHEHPKNQRGLFISKPCCAS